MNLHHKGDGRAFADMDEVEMAYSLRQVDIHARIKLHTQTWYDAENNRLDKPEKRLVDTTVGRVLFNRILPEEIQLVNWTLDKGGLKDLVADLYELCGEERTPEIADAHQRYWLLLCHTLRLFFSGLGYHHSRSKQDIINQALQEAETVTSVISAAACSPNRNRTSASSRSGSAPPTRSPTRSSWHMDPNGNLAAQAISGATKGGFGPISQLAGMRGLDGRPIRAHHPAADPLELP